jgi:hypothetical protein
MGRRGASRGVTSVDLLRASGSDAKGSLSIEENADRVQMTKFPQRKHDEKLKQHTFLLL